MSGVTLHRTTTSSVRSSHTKTTRIRHEVIFVSLGVLLSVWVGCNAAVPSSIHIIRSLCHRPCLTALLPHQLPLRRPHYEGSTTTTRRRQQRPTPRKSCKDLDDSLSLSLSVRLPGCLSVRVVACLVECVIRLFSTSMGWMDGWWMCQAQGRASHNHEQCAVDACVCEEVYDFMMGAGCVCVAAGDE